MKIIAFYLPQYHPIPENDQWWGKNFTEWTNLRKARPLFRGHLQPRIPLNDKYYHLLDPEVQQWQADIAKGHGLDGFCYYHYWFNGKRLLEKPLEQMLGNKSIDFPFCLAWANEPWTRAWDGQERAVLMPQQYGGVEDWEAHFQALLPAFRDPRYIRHENKPMFLIYKTASIPNFSEMVKYWRRRAEEEGLVDLHIVSMLTSAKRDSRDIDVDAHVEFEPMNTISHHLGGLRKFKRRMRIQLAKILNAASTRRRFVYDFLSYSEIWTNICSRRPRDKVYPGAFVGWDNSPRRNEKSTVILGGNPKIFFRYFNQQYKKSRDCPFIFINAWNEWCEGTYLEPDKDFGFGYLEAIKQIVHDDSRDR